MQINFFQTYFFRPIPGQVMHCFAFKFQTLKVTIPTSKKVEQITEVLLKLQCCNFLACWTTWTYDGEKHLKRKRFELISFMWGWVETVQGGKETQKRVNKNYLQPTVVTLNKYISRKKTLERNSAWELPVVGTPDNATWWSRCIGTPPFPVAVANEGLFHSGDDVHSAELSCTHTHNICTYKNDNNALHR